MTQRKIRSARAAAPMVATAKTEAFNRRQAEIQARTLPASLWVVFAAAVLCIQSIVLAFTPFTYLLDEVKVTMFFIMGPLLMLLAVGSIFMGRAPWPPRAAAWGLLAYGIICVLSTMVSQYPYIGKFYLLFNWASAGFFMAVFVVGANRKGAYHLIRFMVVMLLIETLIGFFLHDLTSSIEHRSGINYLMKFLYGSGTPDNPTPIQNLMMTLVKADDVLQSTILNREFFADFCCMLVPLAYLLALYPGPTARPLFWRTVGAAAGILGTLSVYLCQSKGPWIMWTLAILLQIALLLKIGFFRISTLKRGHVLPWLIGALILAGTVAWFKSPQLVNILKKTGVSFESRVIIWSGAWQIFKANWHNIIIGGGPGTFRIYFSAVHSPDYYLHGINNVTTLSHNYIMDLLSETGILGTMTFGMFLGSLILLGLRHVIKSGDKDIKLFLLFTTASVISVFGCNMTSPSGRWVIGATPMWSMIGLLAGLVYQAQKGPFVAVNAPVAPVESPSFSLLPEAVRRVWPQIRLSWLLSLMAIGCFMLGYGYLTGTRYFKSLRIYAYGLAYLEEATNRFEHDANADVQFLQVYFTESIKYLDQSLQIDPTNTSAYYKLGSAYTNLSQLNGKLAEGAQSKGQNEQAKGYLAESDKYLEKAKNEYEELMKYDPDYAEIHYNMGIIYQLYADLIRRGIKNKLEGPEFTPAKADYYDKLAMTHLDFMAKLSIKPEVAAFQGKQYIDLSMAAQRNANQTHDSAGLEESFARMQKARDVFRAASKRPSADEIMIYNYYRTAEAAQDPAGECDALERLWLRRPAKEEYLDTLVQLARQNKFDAVEQSVIQRLEHLNPIHPRLYELKLDLAQRHDRMEEVLAAAENYIRCDGQDLELFQLGAQAAEKLGRKDKAREIYGCILKVDRDAKTAQGQAARRWLTGAPVPAKAPKGTGAAAGTSPTQAGQAERSATKSAK